MNIKRWQNGFFDPARRGAVKVLPNHHPSTLVRRATLKKPHFLQFLDSGFKKGKQTK
jgi:hypothetical protein